jgi:hypothetical protein
MDQPELTVTTDGRYLRLTLDGPSVQGGLLRLLERIVAETKSRDIWEVLVDAVAIRTPLGTYEKYQVGIELVRIADRRMRLAVVGRPELVDHFFETVARNRGGAVAVFTEEPAALHWLMGAKS